MYLELLSFSVFFLVTFHREHKLELDTTSAPVNLQASDNELSKSSDSEAWAQTPLGRGGGFR